MKRFLSILLTLLITLSTFNKFSSFSFASDIKPSIQAENAILMDFDSGEVLFNKNGDSKIFPASTTKAWTAYLVLKHTSDLNEVITIDAVPQIEGASMYLKSKESFTVKELLESLLVHSSNDVAVVLAAFVSGSIEDFIKLMNEEASAIGAKNTHFTNPHGLPDENHYTTAYDMALMGREAMGNKTFREMVKLESVSYESTEAYPYERYFQNTNKFLYSKQKIDYEGQSIDIKYDIVDGIKTGYTDDAGKCLLSSGVKDDFRLISAVFKSQGNEVFTDSRALLDYGFDNFKSETIINKNEFIKTEQIYFSKEKELSFSPKSNYSVTTSVDGLTSKYTSEYKLNELDLPIKKGDTVGKLDIYNDNKLVKTIDLIANNNVNSSFSSLFINAIKLLFILMTLIIIIYVILIIRKKRRLKNIPKPIFSNKKRRRY